MRHCEGLLPTPMYNDWRHLGENRANSAQTPRLNITRKSQPNSMRELA